MSVFIPLIIILVVGCLGLFGKKFQALSVRFAVAAVISLIGLFLYQLYKAFRAI